MGTAEGVTVVGVVVAVTVSYIAAIRSSVIAICSAAAFCSSRNGVLLNLKNNNFLGYYDPVIMYFLR